MSERLLRPGLPDAETLAGYRIWDSYFTPAHSHPGGDGRQRLLAEIAHSQPALELARFERCCYFPHVGVGTTTDAALERRLRADDKLVLAPLERYPELLIGMIQLNANDVAASSDAIKRWLRDGPMVGVYFPGGGPGAVCCTDPRAVGLVERVIEAGGLIMQHTWFKTGGKTGPGQSTPAELAQIAGRYPRHPFVCAHAGGEWQQGIRAVRETENVLVETSGFDATAGFLEMAVRELGDERILFGSHLPSRSLGTELGKVLGADLSEASRRRILGGNLRRILQ